MSRACAEGWGSPPTGTTASLDNSFAVNDLAAPFCRQSKGRVVVFNLTRFARDTYDHFALRSLLRAGFQLLAGDWDRKEGVVDLTGASWNQIAHWIHRLEGLRMSA